MLYSGQHLIERCQHDSEDMKLKQKWVNGKNESGQGTKQEVRIIDGVKSWLIGSQCVANVARKDQRNEGGDYW